MKYLLLSAVAASAMLVASPAYANRDRGPSLDIDYDNNIETSIVTDVAYYKDVALEGTVSLEGTISVDSSAVAVTDVKQLSGLNNVTYREENELNGENGYVSDIFGPGWSEAGNDPNDNLTNGVLEGAIRVGYFAPIINTVDAFDVSGAGNIGVNLSAGYYNMQMNSATLASSSVQDPDASGGWSEASTTSLQMLVGTYQYGAETDVLPEDDPTDGGGGNNFRDRNTVMGGAVSGDGNIGINAAAGSFNQQANLLTLAVATDAALAEANSGLLQIAVFNGVEQQDSINTVGTLTIADASGNIGVNMAAGVGNQQLNSLTIATSLASGGGDGNGGGGGDGS
ncbi:MAG: hypothetical protein E6R09_06590 [Rhodocyclaceae bacterium]|nr:MAG: hypothetical protein E6R09_06590 [Rhodocyclaceae bacterium]